MANLNPATVSPEPWLIIDITTACNLRCKHCHLWMTSEPEQALGTMEKIRLIDEFSAWKKSGKVVLAGGEVFLKPDEVFRLARRCSELGLFSMALTNTTLLQEDFLPPLLASGLSQLSISLDAPTAEIYDYSRGVKGTFEKTVHWIGRIVEEKKKQGGGPLIHVNTILRRGNIAVIPQHFSFLRSLGVDGVFLMPLERTFGNQQGRDLFFDAERLVPGPEFDGAVEFILGYDRNFVMNSEADILLIQESVRGTRSDRQICISGSRNIIVDGLGNVRFCHLMEDLISDHAALGNVRQFSLREICDNERAAGYQKKMQACRAGCEMLSCNRQTVT